jgi:hypothetical protein
VRERRRRRGGEALAGEEEEGDERPVFRRQHAADLRQVGSRLRLQQVGEERLGEHEVSAAVGHRQA